MTGTDLTVSAVGLEIDRLANVHRRAGGVGMSVLNLIGGQAENLLERLPDTTKDQLESVTQRALETAMSAASVSHRVVPARQTWLDKAVATGMGAVGGAGGLPSALVELPVTTSVLLRSIQGVALDHGFDPESDAIRKECILVFATAGPLAADDGADLAFLSARMTLTGATVHGIISKVAPRLAAVLGQKLAAQTIPLIGAAAGAATNYAYISYYQEMAKVHFGLLKLSHETGRPWKVLTSDLRHALKKDNVP
ncbi:MAG: EcsC family protein [Rhodobacteraceae bacterium]|nr:EcsC family protein [Paracoccaceae bacterium]